jgi:hypothetical protein
MTSTRKFSQSPPDKANELIEQLLATSSNAVKARERLLTDLKEELELLASLQEQHLFPVLTKHGMPDLVRDARNDNQATGALISELERMPKNNGEFLGKVAELRKVFQQHIRDDKKQLLPAVLKVLSDEEAEAVVEKVEDEMASIQESKRAETGRAQEQVELVRQVAEDVTETVRAGAEGARTVASTAQEAVQTGLSTVSEMARLSTEQAMNLFRNPQGLGDQTSQQLQAVAQSGTVVARSVQKMSFEWFALGQMRLQKNIEGFSRLAQCRSVPELVAVQTSLFRDDLLQTFDNSRRIAELTGELAEEATRTMRAQTKTPAQPVHRAA